MGNRDPRQVPRRTVQDRGRGTAGIVPLAQFFGVTNQDLRQLRACSGIERLHMNMPIEAIVPGVRATPDAVA